MIFDLQKASLLKRVSAWLFDTILLGILIVGLALLLSAVTGYDQYSTALEDAYARCEAEYGIRFDVSYDEYAALDETALAAYEAAYAALSADTDAMHAYNMVLSLTLVVTSISILLGYAALEFAVPLLLGNGQTLGKKIFSVALMRTDGVRISPVQLFIRTILGKYTIETMIPVLILIMLYFGSIGMVGLAVLGLIALLQIILLAATKNNSLIHDLLAVTVAVDMASQMIFSSEEEMIAYKKKAHAEQVARQTY